ncbi:MAG: diguanylate cyclase [Mariniblastus sp.]
MSEANPKAGSSSGNEEELSSLLLQAMLNLSSDPTFLVDEQNQIRFWNDAAESFFELDSNEIPTEARVIGLVSVPREADPSIANNTNVVVHSRDSIPIGHSHWQRVVLRRSDAVDVADRDELFRLAQTDHLSGLLNRRGFQIAFEENLHQALTLAIVDIDNFKPINDLFGHDAGDQVIVHLAKHLTDHFDDAIAIGRLGGDEFGLVLKVASLQQNQQLFDSFCQLIESIPVSKNQIHVTLSIGVVISESSKVSTRELLTAADKAMYESKRAGKNRATVVLLQR